MYLVNRICKLPECHNELKKHQKGFCCHDHATKYFSIIYKQQATDRLEIKISQYNLNPSKCNHCKENLPYVSRKNKFCSSSCSAKFNNSKRGPRSVKTKIAISKSLTQHFIDENISIIVNNKPSKHCLQCLTEIPRTNKFCSTACNKEYNKLIKLADKKLKRIHREKNKNLAKWFQCKSCEMEFQAYNKRKYCSKTCLSDDFSRRQTEYLKKPENRKKYKGRSQPSYMEESFEQWLKQNGLTESVNGYLKEIHFYNPNTKKHGWVDFLFPRLKLIIELDGTQHRKTVDQDRIRDDYLKSRGWQVNRIAHSEYRKKTKLLLIKEKLGLLFRSPGEN
jgi:very-short-patch-repair endonuclease/predicted nucleic acid-binding Zn ribbon protein